METNKKGFPKVAKISYTPQTLAAAIAKNIRAEEALRDLPNMKHDQARWGSVMPDTLINNKIAHLPGNDKFYETPLDVNYVGVSCGSTGCIAGWASVLAGDVMVVPLYKLEDALETMRHFEEGDELDDIDVTDVYVPEMKALRPISERGQQLLDLSSHEKAWLFHGDRRMKEILDGLDSIASGKRVAQCYSFRHNDEGHEYNAWMDRENYDENCALCKPFIEEGNVAVCGTPVADHNL